MDYDKLKALRDSIHGDCYKGHVWEEQTIDELLADRAQSAQAVASVETCVICGEGQARLMRFCDTCTSEYAGVNETRYAKALHRFGPEMSRLYQLKGAIARQINRIARNDMANAE